MGIEFQDDCTGTFSDKWEQEGTFGTVGYDNNELELAGSSMGTGSGVNCICKSVFERSGVWNFKFFVRTTAESYNDGWWQNDAQGIGIYTVNPAHNTDSNGHDMLEHNSGTFQSSSDSYLFLNFSSNYSKDLEVICRVDGSQTLNLLNGTFTYNYTTGHNVEFEVDFDAHQFRVTIDSTVQGTGWYSFDNDLDDFIGYQFQVGLHYHHYINGDKIEFDTFVFETNLLDAPSDFEISDVVDSYKPYDKIIDALTIADDIDCTSNSEAIAEGISLSEQLGIIVEREYLYHQKIYFDDIIDGFNLKELLQETIAISDVVSSGLQFDGAMSDGFEIGDECDAFNWAEWVRNNKHKATTQFLFTLTGAPNGTTDATMKISTLQATKRNGSPTYLSVVVPAYANLDLINDRPNGEMVVELAYFIQGAEAIREEFLRVEMTDVRPDEGAKNRSLTLTGRKTESFTNQAVTLEKSVYRSQIAGRILHRFAEIDPFLNPGDTATVSTDEFTIDTITYFITATSKSMEVRGT